MEQANIVMNVRRVNATTSIIDIQGEVSAFAEKVLMDAYAEASTPTTRTIILNFSGYEIGLRFGGHKKEMEMVETDNMRPCWWVGLK